jgi:uncharacterized YigZ family protein
MKNFKTVYIEAEVELQISKSRFIGYVTPIKDENDATRFIEKIKKKHWDATHNVPVYVLGENFGIQRYSDDGEPSGTAGVPILDLLKKEAITDVCIVVTRYFGGVKLGTGGLVRAYTQSAKAAIEAAEIVEKKVNALLKLDFDYHFHGKLQNYFLGEPHIIVNDTQFTERISLEIYIEPEYEMSIMKHIIDLTSGQIEIENKGEFYLTIKNGEVVESMT